MGYEAIAHDLNGEGMIWALPHPDTTRTIEQCAAICDGRSGCTGFEYAEGQESRGACGTYTGGESNRGSDEDRLSIGSNWRSCDRPLFIF